MPRPDQPDPLRAACAIDVSRSPLVLAPSGCRGWFGGLGLATADPTIRIDSCTPASAFELLEMAFQSHAPVVAAAILPYDGPASVCVYPGAWRAEEGGGWRAWGTGAPGLYAPAAPVVAPDGPLLGGASADMDEAVYAAAVLSAQEAIRNGDVYVLNLTYRMRGIPTVPLGSAFAKMTARSPAPMAALLAHPGSGIASVSPERFVSAIRGPDGTVRVTAEPIKGTAPRDLDAATDARSAASLLESEKERAEHVMIVDLERNDLGRVCEPGSIDVDPLFGVFGTVYCHQMASVVRGRLRRDVGINDLLGAAFPCGSVTGAPKLAAMREIGQLEHSPRGAYTGALVVAMPGQLDSSVLIRTLEYRDGAATWGTGCGITIDSDPAAEWRESVLKTWPVTGGYSAL